MTQRPKFFAKSGWPFVEERALKAVKEPQGFSLIEVVIALSVVAVAVLSIVGLLSTALLNFGNAMQKSVSTQIHDQVIHDIQQMTWDTATTPPSIPSQPTMYFDAQANRLPDTNGAVYQVVIMLNQNGASGFIPVPGDGSIAFADTNNGVAEPSLATVTTSIYRYPGPTTTPLNWYTDYVARN